ncbi:MAG: hypothetical protein ACK5IA_10775, partial [Cyanobacteriota bacterium]
RASTRRSRPDPGLRIDHGSPLLNLIESPAPALIEPLRQAGWLEPFTGPVALLDARATRHFDPEELDPSFSQGLRLQGLAGDQLKRGRGVQLLVKGHQLLAPERPVPLDSLHRQGI